HALSAFAMRNLAHGERGVQAAIALRDHDAFVSLDALALAFLDIHFDDDGVARTEFRPFALHSLAFERLDDVRHFSPSRNGCVPTLVASPPCSAWNSSRSFRSSPLQHIICK